MVTLLEKTRNITSILKRSEEKLAEELPYNAIASQLADIIDCNSCIVNSAGLVLGYSLKYEFNNDRTESYFQNKHFQMSLSMQQQLCMTQKQICRLRAT